MLETFRKASQTWIVKLLFALLTLSFLAWGVGDVVRRGAFGTGPAIEVGHISLSANDVTAEFKREVERMQPMFGGKLSAEDARKLGVMERTIDSIVTRTLIDEAAGQLGLAASDEAILRQVAADPNLRNLQGAFDRSKFQQVLARMGLSEEGFMRLQRLNQMRNQMADALAGGVAAPQSLYLPLVRHREEQRVADTVTIKDAAVAPPATPDAATLEAYYKANTQRFMAPEFRALTVLLLRPADVIGEVEVTDEMIEESFEQRREEFGTPERRQVSQVVLTDQAGADRAAALVREGKDIQAVAKALGAQVFDLGTIDKGELPDDLAAAAFAQAPGTLAPPVKTDLGWHVIRVGAVTPAHFRTLAEVRGQLEQDIRHEKAGDLLSDLSNKVEDALGGGASLEEAGKRFNLKVLKVAAVDAKGNGPNGKPAANLPKADNLLDVAFHADPGSESQLTENPGDGFFMLRVDSVAPPAPRPFAEVKADVVTAWVAEKRHALARERADQAARALAAGETPPQVARTLGGEAKTSRPFTRDGAEGSGLPAAVIGEMFAKNSGEVTVASAPGAWVVARLAEIVPFDPAKRDDVAQTARRTVSQTVAGDLIDQYLAALNARFGVKIDRSQISREE